MNRQPPASPLRLAAIVMAACFAAAACSVAPGPSATPRITSSAIPTATPQASPTPPTTVTPAPSAPPTSPPAGATAVKVYFVLEGSDDSPPVLVPVHRDIEPTLAVARAAMIALLAGPTDDERAHNLVVGTVGTMIHPDARLLDVAIADGTATVDLSSEFLPLDVDESNVDEYVLTLAQVTYTLTQFPTVDRVAFRVDGRPQLAMEGHEGTVHPFVGRDAYFDQLPPIFLDEPAWGGMLTDPVRVAGRAQIFESQFQVALIDAATGEILVQQAILDCGGADCTPPGGSEFSAELNVPDDAAALDLHLRAWVPSVGGGTPPTVIEYPLR